MRIAPWFMPPIIPQPRPTSAFQSSPSSSGCFWPPWPRSCAAPRADFRGLTATQGSQSRRPTPRARHWSLSLASSFVESCLEPRSPRRGRGEAGGSGRGLTQRMSATFRVGSSAWMGMRVTASPAAKSGRRSMTSAAQRRCVPDDRAFLHIEPAARRQARDAQPGRHLDVAGLADEVAQPVVVVILSSPRRMLRRFIADSRAVHPMAPRADLAASLLHQSFIFVPPGASGRRRRALCRGSGRGKSPRRAADAPRPMRAPIARSIDW